MTRGWRWLLAAGWGCALLAGCGGSSAPDSGGTGVPARGGASSGPAASAPVTLPIEVLADTGRSDAGGLGAGAVIGARAWLARVSEAPGAGGEARAGSPRPGAGAAPGPSLPGSPEGSGSGSGPAPAAAPRPAAIDVPLPSAAPDTMIPGWPSPPALVIAVGLEPPVLLESAPLRIPRGRHAQASVELEMRVDETGVVSEVRWAGGSSNAVLVDAAIECARSMRFRPARRGGEAVAVWCGQRFDFN